MVNPTPPEYPGVFPYLIIKGADAAIAFYKAAFGAEELLRMPGPDNTVGHAELRIAGGVVMLAEEYPEMGGTSPTTLGGTPVTMTFYTADVDAMFARAVAAGATVVHPLADRFYGDRTCVVKDPFGHAWSIMQHIEDVSFDDLNQRAKEVDGNA